MTWKDIDNANEITDEVQDNFLDETDYPPWERRNKSSIGSGLFKKVEIPFILMGVGILILIGFFVVSLFGNDSGIDSVQIETFEKRLGLLEDRFEKLQGSDRGLNQIKEQGVQLERIQNKIDQLETSVTLRMDQFSTEVLSFKKQPAVVEPQTPTAVKTPPTSEKNDIIRFSQEKHFMVLGVNMVSVYKSCVSSTIFAPVQ